jgi:osmotically-inducible protein OsmY
MARLELRLGAPVVRHGQHFGFVHGIVLAGEGPYWEALLVRRGPVRRSLGYVPRSAVRDATDTEVTVDRPPAALPQTSNGHRVEGRVPVWTTERRRLGRVVMLHAVESGRLTHIVVERRPLGPRLMIPAAALVAVGRKGLSVHLAAEAVAALPPYYPDSDLTAAVQEVIESSMVVAGFDDRYLRVSVSDGVAGLTGHISSRLRSELLEAAVGGIPGVLGVANHLVCDDVLEIDVARALGADPRTRGRLFDPEVDHGVVTLNGRAPDAAAAEAATAVTAALPSVRGIVNRIVAPGFPPDDVWVEPPVLGEQVVAEDREIGPIEQLVIDPRRRRFTGMVVSARVPADETEDAPLVERAVFIAAEQIQITTETTAFIAGRALDAARGPLAGERTIPSAEDWQPPFPYRRRDVVWPA